MARAEGGFGPEAGVRRGAREAAWPELAAFSGTMGAAEFTRTLRERFGLGSPPDWIQISEGGLMTLTPQGEVGAFIPFAERETPPEKPPRYWRQAREFPPAPAEKPLSGVRIALDPGHLGGPYAQMEQRSFTIPGGEPVREGDIVLRVAELLAERLRAYGAEVLFVRQSAGPVTKETPQSLRSAAEAAYLRDLPVDAEEPPEGAPEREKAVKRLSELLFFRTHEIQARARRVNRELKPDLVLCLHVDGTAWPDAEQRTLARSNYGHILVHGAYSAAELRTDEARRQMLKKLFNRSWEEEEGLAKAVAQRMAETTGLPPMVYTGPQAIRINDYVWARNLLANRLYDCPVVFAEPHVANSRDGYQRIQAGAYEGVRGLDGVPRVDFFREYADFMAEGVADFYRVNRGAAQPH